MPRAAGDSGEEEVPFSRKRPPAERLRNGGLMMQGSLESNHWGSAETRFPEEFIF